MKKMVTYIDPESGRRTRVPSIQEWTTLDGSNNNDIYSRLLTHITATEVRAHHVNWVHAIDRGVQARPASRVTPVATSSELANGYNTNQQWGAHSYAHYFN